ncbi:Pentalenene oxygenase [Mycobacteroides salmoniphilum]|uniref:Pentalenene oxygenase n=1 Tax=Mycobacteroides salmoniphilum TaxID=404941 RepID=A0A4R8SU53_9MYCO|nr:Pentalenene oxygenase [Mycobacteroides salmoniphilum]
MVSDGEEHRRRRSAVAAAFHHRHVDEYVRTMVTNTDTVIDRWRPGQRIDAYQEFRAAVRRSVAECLFGPRLAELSDTLGDELEPLLALTHLPPQQVSVESRLGSPRWRRAMKNRTRVEALIDAVIVDARVAPRPDDRLLTGLIDGRPGIQPLSDNEIRDLVVSLIADGYETTSGALAWAIYALLTTPGAWETAVCEVRDVLGDRPPTASDLTSLIYVNGVVRETLRLYTPGVISARKVMRDLEFDGHRIRAGRMLIFSPYVTHRIPEIWPEPNEFRPQRWDPTSPRFQKPGPDEFIPFSGGLHRCIGSEMATAEITVTLARLIARTTPRLPAQRIRPRHFGSLRPWPALLLDI